MYLPLDHDPLNFQKALERLEVLFKAPEEGCQEEIHLTLVDLIQGISGVSTQELRSLSGRVGAVLGLVKSFDEEIKKSESVFVKSMVFLGLKSDLKKDLESIPSAMSNEIQECMNQGNYGFLIDLISILPKGLEAREKCLEEAFRGALGKEEYYVAGEIASYMATGEVRESFLDQAITGLLEKDEYYVAGNVATLMAMGDRRESFLDQAVTGLIGKEKYYNAGQIANYMVVGDRRESCLEEAFRNVLEKEEYYIACEIASYMAIGDRRESFLEEAFRSNLEAGEYFEVDRIANYMAAGGRKESFLEEAFKGALGEEEYSDADRIANYMAAGERKESFLEEAFRSALEKGNYNQAGAIDNCMSAGERKESFLEEAFSAVLEKGMYYEGGLIASYMAAGERRENFLEGTSRDSLGCERFYCAGQIASYMAAGDGRERCLEEAFMGLLEEGDYKGAIKILDRKLAKLINSDLFKGIHEKMPILFRIDLFKTLSNLNLDSSVLLSLKQTLFPFSLPPTEKALCTPVFARDIPEPDSNTSLEELKFTLLSGKEAIRLSALKKDLGVQDVPLLKWFALYTEQEGSRLESSAFRELTEEQQNNLRNLSPQELSRFWALNEKKILEEGCLDLYQRIANQAPLWSQGELPTAEERKQVLYDRMSSLTRHLLHHAKEKIEDKEAILAQLAGLSGRCEGVLTEIESMYRLYCLQDTSPASIDAALEAESFYTRQGMIDLFINEHEPLRDVHRATVFKNLVALEIGMPFLLEGPFEQDPYYRNAAEDLAPEFFKLFALSYGETFIKQLEEIMKNSSERSLYKVEVKNGEFELLSELLLKDMAHLGLFEEASLEERKKQLILDLGEQGNWEGEMNLKESFLYMAETKEDAIEILTKENLDLSEKVFLDKLLLYPLLREKLTKEKIADYLVRKGFFEQKNQQIIS